MTQFLALAVLAASLNDVPEPLKAWAPWVLHGEERALCPSGLSTEDRICAWPGPLELTRGIKLTTGLSTLRYL